MNLELRSIVEPGVLRNERITLRATADLDVGDYLVAQTGIVDGSPTTGLEYTFWFPFKLVKKRDLIVLYTKRGSQTARELEKGNTAHFYYLDLEVPIWDRPSKGALVLYAPTWDVKTSENLIRPKA